MINEIPRKMNFVQYDARDGRIISHGSMPPHIIHSVIAENPNIAEIDYWPNDYSDHLYDVDLVTKKLVRSKNPRPYTSESTKHNINECVYQISDRQFYQQAALSGYITYDDAIKAVQSGFVPSTLQTVVDAISDDAERFAAQMFLAGDTVFPRQHPLIPMIARVFGLAEAGMDEFFLAASRL